MANPTVRVVFAGDTDRLARASRQAQAEVGKFGSAAKRSFAVAGAAAAGAVAGIAGLAGASVKAAAAQSANFSKFEQVTKKAMDGSHKVIARQINLSQSSYADYFSQLSAMYQSNGIATEKANSMAAESMKTAADAAAFGNTSVGEAVEAQLGLLKGSGELWEKYSVSIKASDISARMKADGLDKLEGAEKKAASAATRHALAQEASKLFMGQAAKESGSLESRQQKLAATFEDVKAKLGKALLPVVEQVLGKFQQFADWAEQNMPKWQAAIRGPVERVREVFARVKQAITAFFDRFKKDTDGNAAKVAQWKAKITEIWTGIKETVGAALEFVRALISRWVANVRFIWDKFGANIKDLVVDTFQFIQERIRAALQIIKGVFQIFTGLLTGDWSKMWTGIKNVLRGAWNTIVSTVKFFFSGIVDFIAGVGATLLKGAWARLWNAVKAMLGGIWAGIVAVVKAYFTGRLYAWLAGAAVALIRAAFTRIWAGAKAVTSTALAGLRSAVSAGLDRVVALVKGMPGKIVGALSGLPGQMFELGKSVAQGLANGIKNAATAPVRAVVGVGERMKDGIKKLFNSHSPSKVFAEIGRGVSTGMAIGIEDKARRAEQAAQRVADLVTGTVVGSPRVAALTTTGFGSAGGSGPAVGGSQKLEIDVVVRTDAGSLLQVLRKEVRVRGGLTQAFSGAGV